MQLCESCQKYAGGCSWTEVDPDTGRVRFIPVPGWDATQVYKGANGRSKGYWTYAIRKCPEYVREQQRW